MTDGAEIAAARNRASVAHARLKADIERLRHRTSPAVLARNARDRATHAATDAYRAKPAWVLGGAAALAALLLVPAVRKVGRVIGRVAWRNRAEVGQLIKARSASHSQGKDQES